MARIRTIKPEFWSSPSTAACADPWARLLYLAMWNWADDMGRGTANPKELAGFAFPNDDAIDAAGVRRLLLEVELAYGVVLYEVRGRPYYAIPSWDDHQKIDKRSGARHPAPNEGKPWNPGPGGPGRRGRSSADSAESPPSPRRGLDGQSDDLDDLPPEPPDESDSEGPAEPPPSPRRGPGDDPWSHADTTSEQDKSQSSAEPAESPPSVRRGLDGGSTQEQGNRGTGEQGGSARARTHTREARAASRGPATDPQQPEQPCGRKHDPELPCGPCGSARRSTAAADAEQHADVLAARRAWRAAVAACSHCDDTGWTETDSGALVRCHLHDLPPATHTGAAS